jgi:hypothetical protein
VNQERMGQGKDQPVSECSWDRYNALWDEYKYRHDLIWRVTFQVTAAGVIIGISPYLNETVIDALEWWLLALPILALVLVGAAYIVIDDEITLFGKIKDEYRFLQKECFEIEHETSRFEWLVRLYLGALFVLGVFNLVYLILFLLRRPPS